jgi:hypothetical protein
MPLLTTWKRQDWTGTYWTRTDTHKYAIEKNGSRWHLRVYTLATPDALATLVFSSYAVSDGFNRLVDAKVYAQQFADKQGA